MQSNLQLCAMHVSLASGNVIDLSAAAFEELSAVGGSVRTLKQHLYSLTGHRRFVQQLLRGDCLLSDDVVLQWPDCLQLVILSFQSPTKHELEEFATAVERDDAEAVETFLQKPVDAENQLHGSSSLGFACSCGSLKSAKLLLEAGAVKDRLSSNGLAPLHMASGRGHLEVVHWLVGAGANIDQISHSEGTPLLLASSFGHVEVVRFLLAAGADKDATNLQGLSPLHAACFAGNLDVVRCLVQADDDSNKMDQQGSTPLHFACLAGHLNVVKLLVGGAADMNWAGNDGATPLTVACAQEHPSIVTWLVRARADKNKSSYLNGLTPLHFCCLTGRLEAVISLVESGDDKDKVDPFGRTPLHLACVGGHTDIVRWLLHSLADKDKLDALGCTALQRALERDHLDIVQLLNVSSGFAALARQLATQLLQVLCLPWQRMASSLQRCKAARRRAKQTKFQHARS